MPELNTKFTTGFGGQSSGPVPARTILWRLTQKPRNADSKKVYFCQKQLFTILPFLLLCNSSLDSITQLCIFSDAVKNAKDAVKEFSIIPCWPSNFFFDQIRFPKPESAKPVGTWKDRRLKKPHLVLVSSFRESGKLEMKKMEPYFWSFQLNIVKSYWTFIIK